jgi:hypothetical protein
MTYKELQGFEEAISYGSNFKLFNKLVICNTINNCPNTTTHPKVKQPEFEADTE